MFLTCNRDYLASTKCGRFHWQILIVSGSLAFENQISCSLLEKTDRVSQIYSKHQYKGCRCSGEFKPRLHRGNNCGNNHGLRAYRVRCTSVSEIETGESQAEALLRNWINQRVSQGVTSSIYRCNTRFSIVPDCPDKTVIKSITSSLFHWTYNYLFNLTRQIRSFALSVVNCFRLLS